MFLRYFSHSLLALATAAIGGQLSSHAQNADKSAQTPPAQTRQSLPEAPAPRGVSQPQLLDSTGAAFSSSAGIPRFWPGKDPEAQVTVLENTLFRVWTNEPLSSRQSRAGVAVSFTLSRDVVVGGVLIVPRGATVHGTVVETRQAGALSGSPELILKLTSLDLAGHNYPLYTYQFKVTGASKTRPTELKVRTGAILGAVIGGVMNGSVNGETSAAGRLAGAGTGAALGAGLGAAASLATPAPIIDIPAESEMDFFLASPISVVPVTAQEAARLSQGLYSGGPVLYVRGETP